MSKLTKEQELASKILINAIIPETNFLKKIKKLIPQYTDEEIIDKDAIFIYLLEKITELDNRIKVLGNK